jgi:hypothetical protein
MLCDRDFSLKDFVSKDYLSEDELQTLNRIVSLYIELAEL